MNGSAYDVHPYVLLNHNDDYDSLSTYAHEWGHAMHSVLSNAAQPFHKSSYSIFVAEIASITNERLLQDWMLKRAESDQERLFYLGASLEQMRGTFFRQAMFAEFEALMHRRVQEGAALSGEEFTAMYTELLKRYHGHDQGAVTIDDAYCVEWAFIPHFYYNFYVYQYATSIAGAAFFTDQLLNPALSETEKAAVQGRYLKLLKAGGSDYPCDLLKEAGLDMNSPLPYRALAKSMEQIMDEIEALV
jgi:oligoendopeptidase F